MGFFKAAQTPILHPADPSAVQYALKRARLSATPSLVSPLLNRANVPNNTTANITLILNPGAPGDPAEVGFNSALNPQHEQSATVLDQLLKNRFSKLISDALLAQKLEVKAPMSIPWLVVKRVGQQNV